MRQLIINENQAGQRLDKFLGKYLNAAPKSFLYKMMRKKNIVLNEKKATGNEILAGNDTIKLFLSEETIEKFMKTEDPVKIYEKPDVIYENKHICFMNKPWGMLSQKAKPDDISMNELFCSYIVHQPQYDQTANQGFKPSICNRLDRNTTGLIIGGKTLFGLQQAANLLKEHTMEKYYRCIVAGSVKCDMVLEGYLVKKEKTNQVFISDTPKEDSHYIKTSYHVISSNEKFTLLEVQLFTGKTHQIRAHLASIHHPIVGDSKYGNPSVNSYMKQTYQLQYQLLHSYKLVFPALNGELSDLSQKCIVAPLPPLFEKIQKGEHL